MPKPIPPKRKRGKPSLYNPETLEKATKAKKEGLLDWQVAEVIGVHPGTLCEWKTTYPEFAKALKEAGDKPVSQVEAALYRSAMGYTTREEKIFFHKGKVKRIEVVKHYPPNPASMGIFLRAQNPARYRDAVNAGGQAPTTPKEAKAKSYEEFCSTAGYPAPFAKQLEMRKFGIEGVKPRLLLGARGYGKTDYITILGVGYALYLDAFHGKPSMSVLIMTKSDERNAAMLDEIKKACELNGMTFEKSNASVLRVSGLHGKDHSVSAVTVGTSSLRGRHPKLIIMDDPVTEEDVSEATRKRVRRKYNELYKLCKNIVIIGQPVHKADLYETLRPLLDKMEVAHGAIPELDADLEAMQLAGISPESISASYHLKVISETGFPLESVKLIDNFPTAPSFAFIDPSFEGGDYTALTILTGHFDGVAVQGYVFKKAWNHCIPEVKERLIKHKVQRLGFETNSLGDMPLGILRDALSDTGIGVMGKKSTNAKHSRILNAGAYAHLIHLSKTSDRVYIEQVVNYEYGVKNDDAPDSLASCLEMVGLIRGAKI